MKSLFIACSILCLFLGCASTSKILKDIDIDLYPDSYECSEISEECLDESYPGYGLYPDDLWYYDPYNFYYPYYLYDPYYIYYPYHIYDPYYPYYCWKDHRKYDRDWYSGEKRREFWESIDDQWRARREAYFERISSIRQARLKAREQRIKSINNKKQARYKARKQRINRINQARQNRIEIRRARTDRIRSTFQRSGSRSFFRASPNAFRRR